jgi:hypothetical protein
VLVARMLKVCRPGFQEGSDDGLPPSV